MWGGFLLRTSSLTYVKVPTYYRLHLDCSYKPEHDTWLPPSMAAETSKHCIGFHDLASENTVSHLLLSASEAIVSFVQVQGEESYIYLWGRRTRNSKIII